jgi:hypothetical protein
MSTTGPIKLLDLDYEGYFMCRLATDPDPTNEDRGMSGYTMALAMEDRLDQVIRLQATPDFLVKNGRPPLFDMGISIGVDVVRVRYDGAPYPPAAQALVGAKVWLDGVDPPMRGPVFDSRNNITGSDDNMAMVVNPFNLRIQHDASGARLTAIDYFDPANPGAQLWQIFDPTIYQRRLTACVSENDVEVAEAIGVYDCFGYFRDRRRYLEKRIADGLATRDRLDPYARAQLDAELETYRSRIYQLELWGDRVSSKLQLKCGWAFDANGPQTAIGPLGGAVDTSQPWHVKFWFGGWDGDLMIGFMRGTLSVPFTPA